VKVALDYQIFTIQKYGGISRYFYEVAKHLAAFHSERVSCLINSPLYINNYLLRSNSDLKIRGFAVPAFSRSRHLYVKLNRFISPFVLYDFSPDIVHETYYAPKSSVPKGCRTVLTVYDMIHELYPESILAHDRTREHKRIAVDRSDHIICISQNTRNDLIRLLDVPPEKTSVIHLGFTLTQPIHISTNYLHRPFILYVGSRRGYKNFDRLLAAYASYSELRDHFDLVAFGGGTFQHRELEMIRYLRLSQTQVRQVSGDDRVLSGLYAHAAMFVYPSLYEGFGIPPLEAMSFNCPVACTNTSSLPEVVANAAIQFDPLDTDSIAKAMLRLSADSALRSSLIELGRARVVNFSWEQCAKKTLDVYEALLR